mmetsp:Transcript_96760/g.273395  ORF Transcript_96760/g.273395 Transcript_96760/m.273395 type:complete len:267 (-) Transcript_96760:110-910(-)
MPKGKKMRTKPNRPWIIQGTNKGRRATGANGIHVDRDGSSEQEPGDTDRQHPEPRRGCWVHEDELRGPQMTIPQWIGPTPLSNLPEGWHLEYDAKTGRPYFWHDVEPGATTWEDPRKTHEAQDDGASEATESSGTGEIGANVTDDPLQDFLESAPAVLNLSPERTTRRPRSTRTVSKGKGEGRSRRAPLAQHARPQQPPFMRTDAILRLRALGLETSAATLGSESGGCCTTRDRALLMSLLEALEKRASERQRAHEELRAILEQWH